MTDRNQTQPDLLDTFMQSLSSGQPNPPANLDPALASVATMLSTELTPPDPSGRFVQGLEQRITSRVEAGQSHSATLPPSGESELAVTQTDAGWQVSESTQRSRFSEFARLAAAVLAIMLIGSTLIFMFSDREDDSRLAGAPEPTPAGSIGVPFSNDILISWDPEGGDNYKLYIIDALGQNEPRKLTPDQPGSGIMEHLGAWSPDGKRVAYLRSSSTSELMVINVDGTGTINVSETTGVDDVQRFSWSPDGEKLAFSSFAEEHRSIYVANANGSDLQTVISGEQINNNQVLEIAWSPSGDILAFTAFETRFPVLFTVSIDGSDLLKQQTSFNPIGLQWSPAATHLAYTAEEPRSGSRVYVLDPVSGDEQPLTSGTLSSSWAIWSPDFNMLAFSIHDSGGSLDGTAIARIDGSNRQVVTPFSGALDWSPEGSRLVIITKTPSTDAATGMTSTVHIMLDDGRILDSPLVDASIDGWPAWRPNSTPPEPEQIPGTFPPVDTTPVPEFAETPEIMTEPPAAILSYQDQTQMQNAHSYCWLEPLSFGEMEHACLEADRGPPDLPAISVPAGGHLTFQLEGDHSFTLLGAEAVRLVPYSEPSPVNPTFDFPGETIPFEQGPDGTIIIAAVPDGDYSFEVGISMDAYPDHEGNASYAFRVIVGDPDAPSTGSQDEVTTTLTFEDQTQAGIFSYGCNWQGDPVCVDPAGLLYPQDPLVAPEGGNFIFSSVGMDDEPRNHQAYAYPIDGANVEATVRGMFFQYPVTTEIRLPTFGTPEAMNVFADMPPGDYIVAMVLTGSDNSGTYSFHVRITGVSGPTIEPDTTGTIIAIEKWDSGWQIHTAETPDIPGSRGQYYVFVSPWVRVFEPTSDDYNRMPYDTLETGMRVSVAFVGDVDDSDPAYANATEIVILERPAD